MAERDVRASLTAAIGPLPFDKGLKACLRPSAEDAFWEPAAAEIGASVKGQDFAGFLRTTRFREGVRGRIMLVPVGCGPEEAARVAALAPLVRVMMANCAVDAVDPASLPARDPLTRSCTERGAAAFSLPAARCPVEGGSIDAHALLDAMQRCVPVGGSGGSPSLAGCIAVLGVTSLPLAVPGAATRGAAGRQGPLFQLAGSVGLPGGAGLVGDPHGASPPSVGAILSLPAYPGAVDSPVDAALCVRRAVAGLLGMLPCGTVRCAHEGAAAPGHDRPLHECPVCLRKLTVLSAASPGGMGTSAAKVVGRYRALRAAWAGLLRASAPWGAWPALGRGDAQRVAGERVWLRERQGSLVVLDVAEPSGADEEDDLDATALAPAPAPTASGGSAAGYGRAVDAVARRGPDERPVDAPAPSRSHAAEAQRRDDAAGRHRDHQSHAHAWEGAAGAPGRVGRAGDGLERGAAARVAPGATRGDPPGWAGTQDHHALPASTGPVRAPGEWRAAPADRGSPDASGDLGLASARANAAAAAASRRRQMGWGAKPSWM